MTIPVPDEAAEQIEANASDVADLA